MAATQIHPFEPANDPLVARAAELGFEFATLETDTGQTVWEWRHGDSGARAQFVTERVARLWMTEWITRFEAGGRSI